jgi:hypothetical protein
LREEASGEIFLEETMCFRDFQALSEGKGVRRSRTDFSFEVLGVSLEEL